MRLPIILDSFVVSVIYRHPRENVKLFTEQLESSLSKIENDRTIKHRVLTGDFNIDLIKFDINNNTNRIFKHSDKNGFIPTILFPTRGYKSCLHTDRSYILLVQKL